jgi:hypothetical protein
VERPVPPEPPGTAAEEATTAGTQGDGRPPAQRSLAERWLRSFGAFWWDFLIGDTPELLLGALVAIGVLAVLVKAVSLNAAAVGAFPALVVVLLVASVVGERRRGKRPG